MRSASMASDGGIGNDMALADAASRPAAHAIPQLDGLRFLAAFCVMIAHSTFNQKAIDPVIINFVWMFAGIGLVLFFVLSGFVIHYNYNESIRETGGLTRFAIARFARLYPLYFAVVAYEVWSSGWIPQMRDGRALAKVMSFLFVGGATQSWWYGILDRHNLTTQWGPSTEAAWSISTELMMYLLYPLICIGVVRRKGAASNLLLIALLVVGQLAYCYWGDVGRVFVLDAYQSIFGIVAHQANTITDAAPDFYYWVMTSSPGARLWQFLLGVAIANIYLNRGHWRMPRFAMPPGLAVFLLAGFFVFNSFVIYPRAPFLIGSWHAHQYFMSIALYSFLAALVVYCCAVDRVTLTSRFLGSAGMVMAGDATYASYLLHVPILHWVHNNVVHLDLVGLPWPETVLHAAGLLLTYAMIVAVSYGMFRIWEAPARRWVRAHVGRVAICIIIVAQMAAFGVGVAWLTSLQRAEMAATGTR